MYEQAKVAATVTRKLNTVTTTALADRTAERERKDATQFRFCLREFLNFRHNINSAAVR